MTANYWPWWLGGVALATVAITFPLLTSTPLGMSGALARVLRWRGEGRDGQGPGDVCSGQPGGATPGGKERGCGGSAKPAGEARQGPDKLANLVFLLAVVVGGALAGWVGGQTGQSAGISPEFYRLFGKGIPSLLVLFGGGILVGVGTRLSGGCTSGHGLSGCGRLQPGSLVATAVFFGVAILFSFLLERLLS